MKSNSAYARRRPTENDFKFIEQRVRLNSNAERTKANGHRSAMKMEASLSSVNSASVESRIGSDQLSNHCVMMNGRSKSNGVTVPFQINRSSVEESLNTRTSATCFQPSPQFVYSNYCGSSIRSSRSSAVSGSENKGLCDGTSTATVTATVPYHRLNGFAGAYTERYRQCQNALIKPIKHHYHGLIDYERRFKQICQLNTLSVEELMSRAAAIGDCDATSVSAAECSLPTVSVGGAAFHADAAVVVNHVSRQEFLRHAQQLCQPSHDAVTLGTPKNYHHSTTSRTRHNYASSSDEPLHRSLVFGAKQMVPLTRIDSFDSGDGDNILPDATPPSLKAVTTNLATADAVQSQQPPPGEPRVGSQDNLSESSFVVVQNTLKVAWEKDIYRRKIVENAWRDENDFSDEQPRCVPPSATVLRMRGKNGERPAAASGQQQPQCNGNGGQRAENWWQICADLDRIEKLSIAS